MSKDFACPSSLRLPDIFLVLLFSFLTACNHQSPVQFFQSKAAQPSGAKPAKILDDTNIIKPDTPYNKLVVEFQNDLLNSEFAAIEKKAELAVKNKVRLEGGSWKIRLINDALGSPVNRLLSSEDEWQQHFAKIETWKKQFPNSITAYNALAAAYTNYGEQARGQGYANTVTAEDATLSKQRMGQAKTVLDEAANLKDKSPVYYEQLLMLGMASRLSRERYNEIFLEAIKIEPEYQYFYRQMAMNLLPRWNGQPGEWEDFAEETMNSIGGKQGTEMYYQIVANISRLHGPEFFSINRINWEKTLEGFKEFEKDQGMSREKLNEFGRLAMHKQDLQTGCQIFSRIGIEDYDESVWRKKSYFLQ